MLAIQLIGVAAETAKTTGLLAAALDLSDLASGVAAELPSRRVDFAKPPISLAMLPLGQGFHRSRFPAAFKFLPAILLSLVLAGGCATTKVQRSRPLMPTPLALALGLPHPGGDFVSACNCRDDDVPIFVVSGRNIENESALDPFGNQRSPRPHLGVAHVKIGEGLSPEELHAETVTEMRKKKALVKFDRIDVTPTPLDLDPWLVKDEVIRHDNSPWVQAINAQLARSPNRNVCIYVHGYNTRFINNTLLAAEIFHYLGRQGAMISFEWPSESRLLGYIADKGNATYSTRHFRAMLSNLAKECQVDSITIIAHSAGSPIVVNALREIRLLEYDLPADAVREKYKVDRVVLAAPDMDLMEFINAIHDRFFEVANGVAVYASPQDRALKLAQKLYGSKRLGRAVDGLDGWEKEVIGQVEQIEIVDASRADKQVRNFIGHNYFHRDPWVSSDIGAFILGRLPAARGLVRRSDEVFWHFPNDYPERLREIGRGLQAQAAAGPAPTFHFTDQ